MVVVGGVGGVGGGMLWEREKMMKRGRDEEVKKWENERWNEMVYEWEKMKEMNVMMVEKEDGGAE